MLWTEKHSDVTFRLIRAGERTKTPPEYMVVLCHDYGATAESMVPIANYLNDLLGEHAPRIMFALPEAPLALDPIGKAEGRAWWEMDLAELMDVLHLDIVSQRPFYEPKPAGLDFARKFLMLGLREAHLELHVDIEKMVMGGFSQGAMMAYDAAVSFPELVMGLALFSGSPINRHEWVGFARLRPGLHAFQCHGRKDDFFSFNAGLGFKSLMIEGGVRVEFVEHPEGHRVPREMLKLFAQRLLSMLASGVYRVRHF